MASQPIAEVGSVSRVYHAVNPNITTWDALLPFVMAKMSAEVRVVSLAASVGRLRASAASCTTEEAIKNNDPQVDGLLRGDAEHREKRGFTADADHV